MSFTVFLRALLASQDTCKFGHHYADGIDGCGLEMEANVRTSYYGVLRQLVTLLRKDMTSLSDKLVVEIKKYGEIKLISAIPFLYVVLLLHQRLVLTCFIITRIRI